MPKGAKTIKADDGPKSKQNLRCCTDLAQVVLIAFLVLWHFLCVTDVQSDKFLYVFAALANDFDFLCCVKGEQVALQLILFVLHLACKTLTEQLGLGSAALLT